MNILIVDDNPMNVMVVREILNRAGYDRTFTAHSADEMFRILRPEGGDGRGSEARGLAADLILLDLMMPSVDGIEACRMLQREEKLRDIPVIMVTAIGDSRKLAEALDAGATDYVTKPVDLDDLLALMSRRLDPSTVTIPGQAGGGHERAG